MGRRKYANSPTNPTTTLGADIDIGDPTVTLATDPGTEMPTTGPFSFTVGESPDTKPFNAASRSGTEITLVGTAATAHTAGEPVNTEPTETDATKWIQAGEAEIVNADVAVGAGIDASKLADGSVSNTELQYINTLTANAQTALDAKLNTSSSSQTKSGLLTLASGARIQSAAPLYFRSTGTSEKIDSPGSGKITVYVSGAIADFTATGLDVVTGKQLSTQGYFLEVAYLAYETVALVDSDPRVIFIDPISPVADFDIDLPGGIGDYRCFHNASAFDVTLTAAGATGTFDGAGSYVLLAGKTARFREDGQAIANYVREIDA